MKNMEINSCDDLLDSISLHIPPSIIPSICEEAKNDISNASVSFFRYCCKNLTNLEVDFELVKNLAESHCLDENLTTEIRMDFCNISKETQDFKQYSPKEFLFIMVLLIFLGPIGLISNSLIISLVCKCKRLRTTCGYLVCNLAIADLLYIVGTMVYYLILLKYYDVALSLQTYYIFSSFDVMIGSASLLCVSAVTIERVVAITKPLIYSLILTKRRAAKFMAFIWAYCILLFIMFLIRSWINNKNYSNISFFVAATVSFIFPCLIVTFSYIKISLVAVKNMQSDRKIRKSAISRALIDRTVTQEAMRSLKMRPARFREIKIALNLGIMTTPFIIGWGYYIIISMYEVITGNVRIGTISDILYATPFIICCINPVSYIIFTRTLRKETIKTMKIPLMKLAALRKQSTSISETLL